MSLPTFVPNSAFFSPLHSFPHPSTESHLRLPNLFLKERVHSLVGAQDKTLTKLSFKICNSSQMQPSPIKHTLNQETDKRISHLGEMVLSRTVRVFCFLNLFSRVSPSCLIRFQLILPPLTFIFYSSFPGIICVPFRPHI